MIADELSIDKESVRSFNKRFQHEEGVCQNGSQRILQFLAGKKI
jgi:hypothetical protein